MLEWFAARGATELTLAAVGQLALDGETLVEIMTDEQAHLMLEGELRVSSRIMRIRMIMDIKKDAEARKQAESITDPIDLVMPGTKQVKVPELKTQHSDMTPEVWRVYMNGVKAWAALGDQDYARWIIRVYEDPKMSLVDIQKGMTPRQRRHYMKSLTLRGP